jgi:hypothetical protein
MAQVKFGNSAYNEVGTLVTRTWGKTNDRKTYWKFGEQNQFYYLNTLLRYLPAYIVRNELCITILTAIAFNMLKWSVELKKLLTYKVVGDEGSLKYANSDLQLFISPKTSPAKIKEAVNNFYNIHDARGTFEGIKADIKRLNNQEEAELKYERGENCGWILDHTYPDYSLEGYYNIKSNTYLDLDNLLDITLKNKSGYDLAYFKRIIRQEFIPLVINIRLNITRPHTIMWGEVVNGFKNKFGLYKFGDLIDE